MKTRRKPVWLYRKMLEPKRMSLKRGTGFSQNYDLAKELIGWGSIAVDIILSQLYGHRAQYGSIPMENEDARLYHLCWVIEWCVEKKHSASIAQMFSWPEITDYYDESALRSLLKALHRTGGNGVVPLLMELKEQKVWDNDTMEQIDKAIWSCGGQ